MGITKFIDSAKGFLGLDEFEKSSKRKSIKSLLKKLRAKKDKLSKLENKSLNDKALKDKKEELEIISIHIKKGEKILESLNS